MTHKEEMQEIHSEVIKTMSNAEYDLLRDGDTFYQRGMELKPRSGITFTMRQAYAIHTIIKSTGEKILAEQPDTYKYPNVKIFSDSQRARGIELGEENMREKYDGVVKRLTQ